MKPVLVASLALIASASTTLVSRSASAADDPAPNASAPMRPIVGTKLPLEPAPVKKYRNPAMRNAGIVLTSIGAATLAGGVGLSAYAMSQGGEFSPVVVVYMGLPLVAASTVLAGIGIPLWVSGSRPALGPRNDQTAVWTKATPTVSVGLGSASLRWTF